jgi:PIN domain nuclease of toxin-antitoxin system
MIVHVVDAHPLIWMLEGNPRLGPAARAVMADPVSKLVQLAYRASSSSTSSAK